MHKGLTTAVLTVLVAIGASRYFSKTTPKVAESDEPNAMVTNLDSSSTRSNSAERRRPASLPSGPAAPVATERSVNQNGHTLERALGSDETARKMLRLFQLTSEIHVSEAARSAHLQYLAQLRANAAFGDELLTTYERLKDRQEFELETAGILSLLATSNVSRRAVNALAETEMLIRKGAEIGPAHDEMTEMERDVAMSTGSEMILPIVAHRIFLETAASDHEKFQGTLSAIRRQGNYNIRSNMLSQFASMVPNQYSILLEALERDGIQMASN